MIFDGSVAFQCILDYHKSRRGVLGIFSICSIYIFLNDESDYELNMCGFHRSVILTVITFLFFPLHLYLPLCRRPPQKSCISYTK